MYTDNSMLEFILIENLAIPRRWHSIKVTSDDPLGFNKVAEHCI